MREQYPEINLYYEMRDFYAQENQLFAKYYNAPYYCARVGLPGEGAEQLPPDQVGTKCKGKGDGGSGRKRSFGRGGGGRGGRDSRRPDFISQGFRASYNVQDLYDPKVIGSGRVGGQLYWPPGFSRNKAPKVLKEIRALVDDDKPLSVPAVTYLGNLTEFKDYIKKVLDYSEEAQALEKPQRLPDRRFRVRDKRTF